MAKPLLIDTQGKEGSVTKIENLYTSNLKGLEECLQTIMMQNMQMPRHRHCLAIPTGKGGYLSGKPKAGMTLSPLISK